MMTKAEILHAGREALAEELGAAGVYTEDWETVLISELRARAIELIEDNDEEVAK